MDFETKTAFLVFKPVCDKVALSPNKSNLSDLQTTVGTVPLEGLQKLKEYVLFPLELHLHNHKNLSKEVLTSVVECLKAVLCRVSITELKNLLKLYSLLFLQISGTEEPGLNKDVPEELKLSVVECVAELFLKSEPSILLQFYTRKYYPKLSLGVYACCQLVKEEKFHTLRISAMNCLLVMTGSIVDGEVKKSCSNVVMLMLPGIVSLCQSTAISSVTQNHQVTQMALRLWSHVVIIVMNDKWEVEKDDIISLPLKANSCNKEKVKMMMDAQRRSLSWLEATGKQLAVVAENIVKTQSHSHWKVRHELAVACDRLIFNCSRNMEPSLMFLVDALIVLSQDEIEAVSNAAKTALQKFSQKCELDSGKSLVENVEENFFHLVTKLPRIVNGTDENVQLSELTLLGGYLSLLGPSRLPHMLNSSAHLEKLISTLIHLMELDTTGAKIIEEEFIVKDYDDYKSWSKKSKSWRTLRHFSSENLIKKLEEVCRILSDCCGNFIAHHLLDLYETNSSQRKEITLILNLIAACELEKNKDLELMNAILDVYLEPTSWYLAISKHDAVDGLSAVYKTSEKDLSLTEIRSNVVQICLMVEGIGDIALAVGDEMFSPCLLRCLYLLLERAGSPLEVFSEAGLYALSNIMKVCNLKDMTALIDSYSDYLIHHVSLRLKNVNRYPQVLNVFIVIISKCTIHALPSLQEIINNVLMYSCDIFQDKSIVLFLHVFLTFVTYAQKWMQSDESKNINEKPSLVEDTKLSPIESFLEFHRLKQAASNFDDSVEDDISMPDNNSSKNSQVDPDGVENSDGMDFHSEPENKKEVPETIKITISILSRTLNFLPYKDESLQLLVLQILDRGILVMQDWTDELLPVVHKIWAPLVERFSSLKPLIIHHSFKLLLTMATFTKDFIRKRTIDEVLPKLLAFLSKTEKDSYLRDVGSAYRMTQQFKLQLALLNGLGKIVIDLDCLEKTSHNVLTCASVYLSTLQPMPLQQSTLNLYETVALKYKDLAWLILVSLKEKMSFVPPDPIFPSYEFVSTRPNTKDYQKNVDYLLERI